MPGCQVRGNASSAGMEEAKQCDAPRLRSMGSSLYLGTSRRTKNRSSYERNNKALNLLTLHKEMSSRDPAMHLTRDSLMNWTIARSLQSRGQHGAHARGHPVLLVALFLSSSRDP